MQEGPPRRICTRFFEGGPLTQGSWWGNIVNRKPSRGGGGFFRSTCNTTYSCVILLIHVWCDFSRVLWRITWPIRMGHELFTCDMTHSHVTWPVHVWHDLFTCDITCSRVRWLIHVWRNLWTCDTTHPHVTWPIRTWHDVFTCGMTYPCGTWLVHVRHDLFMCNVTYSNVTWRIQCCRRIWRMWRIRALQCVAMCVAVCLIYMWHDVLSVVVGWDAHEWLVCCSVLECVLWCILSTCDMTYSVLS